MPITIQRNVYEILSSLYGSRVIIDPNSDSSRTTMILKDRTQELSFYTGNDPENWFGAYNNSPTPLPAVKTTDKTIATIAEERVQEIKTLATEKNKQVVLFWSGGIDSTLALVAMFKAENFEFYVACDEQTRYEYPALDAEIRAGAKAGDGCLGVMNAKMYSALQWSENFICVTGELGDQLCGSARHFTRSISPTESGMTPYLKIDDFYLRPDLTSNWVDIVASKYHTDELIASLSHSPNEITSFTDFLWWFNFTLKYHFVENRILANPKEGVSEQLVSSNSWQHFFAGEEWQRWAMSNREANNLYVVENDPKKYKQPFKDYIVEFTGDTNYQVNKLKGFSNNGEVMLLRYEENENF